MDLSLWEGQLPSSKPKESQMEIKADSTIKILQEMLTEETMALQLWFKLQLCMLAVCLTTQQMNQFMNISHK